MEILNNINKLNKSLNHHKRWLILLVIGILIISGLLGWQRKEISKIVSSFLGVRDKAVFSLNPSNGSFEVGETFEVKILLDTKGNDIVSAGAYLQYDPEEIEVVKIDSSQSDFNLGSPCSFQGKPCEIINHNSENGEIEIVESRPSPGVNKSNLLVASLTLKGLKEANPAEDNFVFQFTGPYQGKSRAILDNGQGSDVLSGVENGRYSFTAPSPEYNPDLDSDNDVNYNDLILYITYYQQGDLQADVNHDGNLNYKDLISYILLYRQYR